MKTIQLFALSLLLLMACSNKESPEYVNIDFSFKDKQEIQNQMFANSSSPLELGLFTVPPTPTIFSDFNCYGVFVTQPEDPSPNVCENASQTAIISRPNDMGGMAPFPGGQVSFPVKIGASRFFQVIGFQSNIACPDIKGDFDSFDSDISEAFVLGATIADITPQDNNIQIDITSALPSTFAQIGDCQGPLFDFGGAGVDCGISPSFALTDRDFLECRDLNGFRFDTIDLSDAGAGDVYIVRTTSGNFAKLQVNTATATSVTFAIGEITQFEKLTSTTATNSGSVTLNSGTPCLELDTSGANIVSSAASCGASIDVTLFCRSSPSTSCFLTSQSGSAIQELDSGKLQSDTSFFALLKVPPTDLKDDITNLQLNQSECKEITLFSGNDNSDFSPVSATTTALLTYFSDSGSVVLDFYNEATCTTPIPADTVTINAGASQVASGIYIKQTGSPGSGTFPITIRATGQTGDDLLPEIVTINYVEP